MAGNHSLSVKLIDKEKSLTNYMIRVMIKETRTLLEEKEGQQIQQKAIEKSVLNNSLGEEWQRDFEDGNKKWFASKIDKIHQNGKVIIKFNSEMRDTRNGVNLTSINASVLNVSLKLNPQTLAMFKKNPEEMQNLTWVATEFLVTSLTLQLEFMKPIYIGQLQHAPDMLVVNITD